MNDHLFAVFDIGLAFALVLGLAVWQLVKVRASIRADRERAARERSPPP